MYQSLPIDENRLISLYVWGIWGRVRCLPASYVVRLCHDRLLVATSNNPSHCCYSVTRNVVPYYWVTKCLSKINRFCMSESLRKWYGIWSYFWHNAFIRWFNLTVKWAHYSGVTGAYGLFLGISKKKIREFYDCITAPYCHCNILSVSLPTHRETRERERERERMKMELKRPLCLIFSSYIQAFAVPSTVKTFVFFL
jgi:hypothetical protein